MPPVSSSHAVVQDASRARKLQLLGILCGFAAGAWLGAAEAPTKLVSTGISPMVISFIMVIGVFLARWSLPALILGTSSVRADVRRAPHLIIWALLAGCLWAVANTLTIFAIRDIGLSIAQIIRDRKSTRLNSSHVSISYAVFCLKKKNASAC